MTPAMMAVALIGGHALADYPLQGAFLAKAKSPANGAGIPGVPWWQAMGAHAAIHGSLVAVITGVWWLGLCEAAAHFLIDREKCLGAISFNTDQALHLGCKAVWLGVAVLIASHP